jgi:5-methylcytosine-specific restriction endonuclease McrA
VNSRYIKVAVKRKIWKRDEARCQFVSSNSHRCEEKHGLQLDHIQPFALGGPATEENLRLLCGAHNRGRNKQGP